MPTMNHEKVNLQKRVAGQGIERPSPACFARDVPDWPLLPFGRYKGLTLPSVFFIDPEYFKNLLWMLKGTTGAVAKLREQAITIAHLSKHILPPAPNRSNREFVILEDLEGRSAGFVIVTRGQKLKGIHRRGLVIADRVAVLDMAYARDFDDAQYAYAQFGRSLRQVFFKDKRIKPTFDGYTKFLTNQKNFDVEPWKGLTRKGSRRYKRRPF